MFESPGYLRVRHLAAVKGAQLALLLVVIALVLAGVAVFLSPPAYVTENTYTDEQVIQAELGTTGTVVTDTPPYKAGERLEDLPVYVIEAVPVTTVSGTFTAPEGTEATVETSVVYRAYLRGEDTPFWTERDILQTVSTTTDNGDIQTEAQLDAVATRGQLADYQIAFGPEIEVKTSVETTVDYETGKYQGTLTASSPLTFTSKAYQLPTAQENRIERTAERTQVMNAENAVRVGPTVITHHTLFFGGVSLVALLSSIFVFIGQRRLDPEVTAEQLQYLRYSEWISSGEIIRYGQWHTVYKAESLEDLIDIAIDTDERVLYDKATSTYFVVSGLALYVCPSSEASDGILDWFSWY